MGGAALGGVAVLFMLFQVNPGDAGFVGDPENFRPEPHRTITQPLRVHPDNPRYFADGHGRAVVLAGSHTWNSLQRITPQCFGQAKRGNPISPPAQRMGEWQLDYPAYLRFLVERHHNFFRLWTWEQASWLQCTNEKARIKPTLYLRTGPGTALDGGAKFDLARLNDEFFQEARARVAAAAAQEIYVAVMLFQGWSVEKKGREGNPWPGHPFHAGNNINGIDGDLDGDGEGQEVHTLQPAAITRLQETYARRLVETLNEFDNVLWEICNEGHRESLAWQDHMARFIKECEARLPKRHPVGITSCFPDGENDALFETVADWISPNQSRQDDYRRKPPADHGGKVVISDTDHLWGIGGNRSWVWKTFTRGLHPIFMDPIDDKPTHAAVRRALGHVLHFASRMNLAEAQPHGDLASSGFCLAAPNEEYLVYLPFDAHRLASRKYFSRIKTPLRNVRRVVKRSVELDLSSASGTFRVEWFNPATGEDRAGGVVSGGARRSLQAPFTGDAVAYVHRPR